MPGYLTKQESVCIAGVANLQIRSLLNREQFSDPLGEAERVGISSAMWPLFGLLWPAGTYLAEQLALRPVVAADRILEMGCGLGLASLVAHRRGADVTASDKHPLAALFLRENLRLNQLPPMAYRSGDWAPHAPATARLTPNSTPSTASPAEPSESTEFTPCAAPPATPDATRVQGRFNLLMGSDLLYERDASPQLAGFIGRHAAPSSEVWIVDPNRGHRAAFGRSMKQLGYTLTDERILGAATATQAAWRGHWLVYRR
jgi:predicted nicotinamide N-methyase